MKSKIKIIAISFTLMILIDILLFENLFWHLRIENPHIGLLLCSYGSFSAVLGNVILDLLYGYPPIDIILSAIFIFGVSYLAYKLWYSGFKTNKVTKPRLDNLYHHNLFLAIILICGIVYSTIQGNLARSYTELINHNNSYIENIHEIEGEKELIEAELNVATTIPAANLPTKEIENEDFIVNGYFKPTKEVGGDFFDYYTR